MKGVVIKSFEQFVEDRFGDEILDQAMEADGLSTGGAFTSIGNYPHTDFLICAEQVSRHSGMPMPELVHTFGHRLFFVLGEAHEDMVVGFASAFDLLANIESVIHVNVRKLYSDTELPRFDVEERDGDRFLKLRYRSARPFADLAAGLVDGCLEHYRVEDQATIKRYDNKPDGTDTTFEITLKD